jgi:hypothetical protein
MDEDEQRELISRLFYVLTARLEDAAALAAEGQGKEVATTRLTELTSRLTSASEEFAILAEATAAIVQLRWSSAAC